MKLDARSPEFWKTFWLRYRIRIIFALSFLLSQAINIWQGMPDYAGLNVFGFPLLYVLWEEGTGYAYFDMITLFLDMLIIYLAVRTAFFAYTQITKYKIME
jgi:hypothetical protein